jgi:hypothetical protein
MGHFTSHNIIQKRKDADVIEHGLSFQSLNTTKESNGRT